MNVKYSDLLNSYIEMSGLTLDQLSDRCKDRGVDIHPTYISKLRKAQRPAPSEEISRALAEACNQNPEQLIFAGYLEKTPSPIIQKFVEYEGIFDVVKNVILQAVDDEETLQKINESMETNYSAEEYKYRFNRLPLVEQIRFINAVGIGIKTEQADDHVKFWIEFNGPNTSIYNADNNESFFKKQKHIDNPVSETCLIPVVGRIAAGVPILAEQNIEEYYPLPKKWVNGCDSFLLKVEGDSMEGVNIYEGNYALIRQQNTCDNGQICAVGIIDEYGEYTATLKRVFLLDNGSIELVPENPKYPRKVYPLDKVQIFGVLTGSFQKF